MRNYSLGGVFYSNDLLEQYIEKKFFQLLFFCIKILEGGISMIYL